ncbi:MAG: aspartate/glutamate racemase family protein [Deltaproteobacteria bacterium]|nr:aspartate/glutamate racemase family protein [Deltaproteobacteria bacterium]
MMDSQDKKYRFLLIPAFRLPADSRFAHTRNGLPKEQQLMNFGNVEPLLADVAWDLHEGALATYGDWAVENREEFCHAAAGRLPIVREACKSGKYNALVLLGGGEPGFFESREIARKYGIPVTSCAFSQMHIATMLGHKFSVIDIAESHNLYYQDLVVRHRFADRCASIRNLQYPHPRPGLTPPRSLHEEKQKALRGEPSPVVDRAVEEAIAAIEEDGAEVITFGCSGLFWLQPFVKKRLGEIGWEVPVLEGYSCAITLAKTFVDLGVDSSGLAFPGDHPKKWRRKKLF